MAAAFGTVLLALSPFAVRLLPLYAPDVSPSALDEASGYLAIAMGASPIVFVATTATATLQGGGDTKTPLLIGIFANAVHVGLNRVLILGLGPIPAYGARGAAAYNEVIDWAVKHDIGVEATPPAEIEPDDAWLARRLGTFSAALTELTIKRNDDGYVLETVAINPFTDEKAPAVAHTVVPVEDGFYLNSGPLVGRVIDYLAGSATGDEPFEFARLSRLAKRI